MSLGDIILILVSTVVWQLFHKDSERENPLYPTTFDPQFLFLFFLHNCSLLSICHLGGVQSRKQFTCTFFIYIYYWKHFNICTQNKNDSKGCLNYNQWKFVNKKSNQAYVYMDARISTTSVRYIISQPKK